MVSERGGKGTCVPGYDASDLESQLSMVTYGVSVKTNAMNIEHHTLDSLCKSNTVLRRQGARYGVKLGSVQSLG